MIKIILFSCMMLLLLHAQGCTTVQPWQRGYLARPDMAFDPNPVEARYKSHTYTSKEAASGGSGVGGGGCGCN